MPRSKSKQKKKNSNMPAEAPAFLNPKQEIKLDALIEEAESAIDSFNYEEAAQKLLRVLEIKADHVKALEMLAGIYTEESNWTKAETLLKQCIDLSPENGHSKYFSLAQLCDGEESLALYRKGIQILEKELENSENVNPSKETDRKSQVRCLSDAYCSISEIYMTDCCFAENAEENCFMALEAAVASDPTNQEAFQCLANFHLVKEQTKEAKELMQKSLSLWLPHHEALRDGEPEATTSNIEDLIPTYNSRIQTSKLLIELEMYDEATNILDGLVEEDDEVVEVWYLLGWMNYIQGNEYKLNAHFYLNKGKEVSEKLGVDDADYISHIHELIEELKISYPLEEVGNGGEEEELGSDISSDSENEDNKMET